MSFSDRLLEFDLVLTKILPDRVAGAVASVEEGAAFQFAEEGALRAKAGAARQQEFIAGRKCARAALAELGQLHGPILANGKGAPVWPDGFVGSITHCKGFCGALAARSNDYLGVGIDLERTNRLSASAQKHVLHAQELDYVEGDQGRATLVFSLKETFYKLQHPMFSKEPGFQDVCFKIDNDAGAARIDSVAKSFPTSFLDAALAMQFRFVFSSEHVFCAGFLSR